METTDLKRETGTDVATDYELKPEERTQVLAHVERRKQKPTAPKVTVTSKAGVVHIAMDHPVQTIGQTLLMQSLGVTDLTFYNALLSQLINVTSTGSNADEQGLNAALAMVRAIQPQDEAEAMLAAQMAAVHLATMKFARRINHVENVGQQDSAVNAFNKLARTYAGQLEALKRYRTGGEQRVTVQHVTVNEGGQAIVGSVSAGARKPGGGRNGEAAP